MFFSVSYVLHDLIFSNYVFIKSRGYFELRVFKTCYF